MDVYVASRLQQPGALVTRIVASKRKIRENFLRKLCSIEVMQIVENIRNVHNARYCMKSLSFTEGGIPNQPQTQVERVR